MPSVSEVFNSITEIQILGAQGGVGSNGWTPIIAIITDSQRRVLKVVDWADGPGDKPDINVYITATGYSTVLANAVDIRGPVGSASSSIEDQIVNGVADKAPSQNAVFDALALKSSLTHTHAMSDITGLVAALASKAEAIHTHSIADTTGLQTALDGKAALVHTHAISDVTGLTAGLAGKASNDLTSVSNTDFSAKASAAGVGTGTGTVEDTIDNTHHTVAPSGYAVAQALLLKAAADLSNITNTTFLAKATAAGVGGSVTISQRVGSSNLLTNPSGAMKNRGWRLPAGWYTYFDSYIGDYFRKDNTGAGNSSDITSDLISTYTGGQYTVSGKIGMNITSGSVNIRVTAFDASGNFIANRGSGITITTTGYTNFEFTSTAMQAGDIYAAVVIAYSGLTGTGQVLFQRMKMESFSGAQTAASNFSDEGSIKVLATGMRKGQVLLDNYVPSDQGLDATLGLQQAIADVVANGGGEVLLGARQYLITSPIGIASNNVYLRGVNKKVSTLLPYGNVFAPVYWQGGGISNSYSLAQGFQARSQFLYLTSVAGLNYGDSVYITCSTPRGGLLTCHGYIVVVNSGSNYIALDRDIPFSSNEGSIGIGKTAYLDGGGMSDIGLKGWGSTNASACGVWASSTKNQVFKDLYYEGFNQDNACGAYMILGLDNCFYGEHYLQQCGALNTTNTADWFMWQQGGLKVDTIHSHMASGFGPQLQWCSHADVNTIISHRAGKRGMKVQGSRSCTFKTIRSTWATYIGLGLSYDAKYNHFADVHITFSGEVVGNRSGLWFADMGNMHNKFSLVESYGAGEYEVAFYPSDTYNWIGHLSYSGDGSKIYDGSGTNTIQSYSVVP